MAAADRPLVHPRTRAEWRAWLAEHHEASTGCWLVRWRSAADGESVAYDDAVEEALCFGWIDSQVRTIDAQRSGMLMTPRKRGSGWARTNKVRLERLEAQGLLAPAGIAMVEAAKADGSWTLLDDVEDLIVPADLQAALASAGGAQAAWDGFPPGARKAMLTWVVMAKTPATRERRVLEIAARAAEGERAGPAAR